MNFIKCEKLEKSMAELQFSIDAEAFKAAVADVFKKEGKKYPVQGFRKGKAPKALIEKMYGADVFTYDAINELFPAAYEEAVKAAGIEPVGRPEVSVDSASEAEGATLTVKVAVKPEVKIGAYNGLTVEKTVHTVSDESVEAELKRVQERNARELTREGAAENGDIVDIDFEGFVDGVAFEGGKAEHYSLTLGSGSFIPASRIRSSATLLVRSLTSTSLSPSSIRLPSWLASPLSSRSSCTKSSTRSCPLWTTSWQRTAPSTTLWTSSRLPSARTIRSSWTSRMIWPSRTLWSIRSSRAWRLRSLRPCTMSAWTSWSTTLLSVWSSRACASRTT